MKKIKKVLWVLAVAVMMCAITPTAADADTKLTASGAVKKINSQIAKAKSFNFVYYNGKISSSKLVFKSGVNPKKKIQYNNWTKMGLTETYYYKNKMYWYNKADKKWYYQNVKKMPATRYNKISSKAKCAIVADKKFNGKKCTVLKVTQDDEVTLYYLNKSNNEWIGMESDGYLVTVNLKKEIKVPSKVLKAKKKTYKLG